MSAKATHYGTCQICGREQKLPGDRMSKHGYTTRWGFFEGVCPGAGHVPFEVGTDLIEAFTAAAEARGIRQRALEAEQRAGNGLLMRERYYRHGEHPYLKRWKGGYVNEEVTVALEVTDYGYRKALVTFNRDGVAARDVHGTYESEIATMHRVQADRHAAAAKGFEEYVVWQRARLAKWTPQPLRPVADQETLDRTPEVGEVFTQYGSTWTITGFETRTVRGCGPYLNGQMQPHAVVVPVDEPTRAPAYLPVSLISGAVRKARRNALAAAS
jgi:hypothetical protein